MDYQNVKALFPFMNETVYQASEIKVIEKDAPLHEASLVCDHLFFVLEGEVRVFKMNDEGKAVTLYLVKKGETCLSNASMVLEALHFPVHAVSLTRSKILRVPKTVVEQGLIKDIRFVRYMMQMMMLKLNNVVDYYEAMSFSPVKERVSRYIEERTKDVRVLYVTHQEIAEEIGTSREVVSRHLKALEEEGKITLKRGKIIV